MIATWVNARLTPLTFDEASSALAAALRDALGGKSPSREALALACAKSALETWRWRSIWNSNFGNIKAGSQYAGNYCTIELNEVLVSCRWCGDPRSEHQPQSQPNRVRARTPCLTWQEHFVPGPSKVFWFSPRGRLDRKGGKVVAEPYDDPPGHPQTRMRAYANRFDGAFSYVDFVASGRYRAAWQKLLAGDAAGYVHALKVAGYFTAPEADYAKGVISMQKEFAGKLAGQRPEAFDPPDHEWEKLRAAIIGSSWERTQDAIGRGEPDDDGSDPAPGAA